MTAAIQPAIQRVVLEFDNEIQILEGDDARKWLNEINQKIVFAYFHHGEQLSNYNWKIYGIKSRETTEETIAQEKTS